MSHYRLSRLEICVRTLLASVGGYALALSFCAGTAALCNALFDMPRAEAFVLAAMLAFLVWMLAGMLAYAAATGWRAAAWILGGTLLFGGLAWLLSPLPAPGSV